MSEEAFLLTTTIVTFFCVLMFIAPVVPAGQSTYTPYTFLLVRASEIKIVPSYQAFALPRIVRNPGKVYLWKVNPQAFKREI